MNNVETTYILLKKLILIREDLANWARLSREDKLGQIHEKEMIKQALEVDELLREIGTEWMTDYEENVKIRARLESKSI